MNSVEEIGERKIIEIIIRYLERMPEAPIPFGDDAAAIDIGHGSIAVIQSDMLVGKTDVPPGMSIKQAARKAVVMNVSDFAAKGVKPLALLASIGLPRGFTKESIEEIGKGLNVGAREYGAYVIGGDTNEASDLIVSCTVFGICRKGDFMRRHGARLGDIVATTGFFGKTASGLKILLEKFSAPQEIKSTLVDAVLMPHARLKEGIALAQTKAITSSIDSSDGLAWGLHELSRSSGVGFHINVLPIAREAKDFADSHNLDPKELVLYGGEEYELIVTIKPELWKKVGEAMKHVGTPLTKIGFVTDEPTILLKTEDKVTSIEARGWEHFKTIK